MSETIKCPCCGSKHITLDKGNPPELLGWCANCFCHWNEAKRQPPQLTPEGVWDWFCDCVFKDHIPCRKIWVDNTYGKDRLEIRSLDYDTTQCVINKITPRLIKALGLDDMPERVRGEK